MLNGELKVLLKGNKMLAHSLTGLAKQQMAILENQMQLGNLNTYARTLILDSGAVITAIKSLGFKTVIIDYPLPVQEKKVELIIIPGIIKGVIFHPRSGSLVALDYIALVNGNYLSVQTTLGVIGGWKNGLELLTTEYIFPLDDFDNASFVLATPLKGDFTKDKSKYGNLYWCGIEGSGNTLSWKGTPTRHFRLPSSTNIPGLSTVEDIITVQFEDIPEYTAFGTSIYKHGKVVMAAPKYNWPTGGQDRCFILGVMQNSATGVIYIVAQSDRRNAPVGVDGPGFYLTLWKTVQESDIGGVIVDNWKLVYETNYGRNGLPWFGNSTGTEFVCSNGDKLTTEGVLTPENSSQGSYEETYTGETGNEHWNLALQYTGNTYFEFIAELIAKAVIGCTFSAVETASLASKADKTYTNDLPGLFALEDAESKSATAWEQGAKSVGGYYCIAGGTWILSDIINPDHNNNTYYNSGNDYLPHDHWVEGIETKEWIEEWGGTGTVYFYSELYALTSSSGRGIATEVLCGETPYYTITECNGSTLMTGDMTLALSGGTGPISRTFEQTTDYLILIAGITIPIVRTRRNFSFTVESTTGEPLGPVRGISDGSNYYATFCDGVSASTYLSSIEENCAVEKCTLHYIDQRYGVVLYKYVKEEFVLSATSPEYAKFNGTWGAGFYWKLKLLNSGAIANCVEEWRLIINGIETVISSVTYQKGVLPGTDNIGDLNALGCGSWVPDTDVGLQVIIPQPDLEASTPAPEADHPEYFCDVIGYGFYKSGELYSRVDYFYPDWCKAIQNDPFWIAAEEARIGVVYDQNGLTVNTSYIPPDITVDPIPIGSYAKHPTVGEVYQWLTKDRNGETIVTTSPDLIAIIDAKLPEGLKTHDTTLIYPISLA